MEFKHKRLHARAPLRSFVLYEDVDFVFKARLQNISEGGILVENFPHLPGREEVSYILDLPKIPDLSKYSDDNLFALSKDDFKRRFIRVKAKSVRRVGETSNVDDLFIQIGCQFLNLVKEDRSLIHDYVEIFRLNMHFLIGLLEDDVDEIGDKRIHKLADLIGYSGITSRTLLHKKLVTDSASLFQ